MKWAKKRGKCFYKREKTSTQGGGLGNEKKKENTKENPATGECEKKKKEPVEEIPPEKDLEKKLNRVLKNGAANG